MPKRGFAALLITTGALILLLSFKTPDPPVLDTTTGDLAGVPDGAQATPTPVATQPAAGATATPGTKGATPAPSAAGGSGSTSSKVDGPVVQTQFGDIQVEVVVAGGKLQDVVALQLPTGRRSGQISQYAEPILHQEALQASSAKIDVVSGATYTSDAYARSLQAALDQAGLT